MMTVQEQLRNAGEQVEGTGTLLEQAADQIDQLKKQAVACKAAIRRLEAADKVTKLEQQATADQITIKQLRTLLETARKEINQIAGLVADTAGKAAQDLKQAQTVTNETTQRVAALEAKVRNTRDELNKQILQAVK